ncbi:MAG: ATP-grasp domain-containing protein [Planctomycetes bacterium]|nr:ATP-grasp domain-containing protein [Planctomycetota bacterium]
MSERFFDKVLIANRGEIAVRVIHSLKTLGIRSVAVHSEADRGALHVRLADEAIEIGPAPARESYLDQDRVIAAARESGAQAIHPGYGFLSENAEFSARCEREGLVFIGPSAESIRAMGDKAAARDLAERAGVPVVPGRSEIAGDDELLAAADEVGFPLLLKPSAGGGGKGMTVVHRREDLIEAAAAGRRLARAAFGDDRLIVERFVRPARHVEIQVFGDGAGRAVAIGERECSLQRRHQKVVEECPSPVVGEALRQRMQAAAVALAEAVRYRGAGTVEFLLAPDQSFYFLEMNTRLQVEHPVTEMVYGVDLVAAQLQVAAGQGLPAGFDDLRPRGAAIELRLYAEDPERDFLPTPGRVLAMKAPFGPGLRFDTAIEDSGEVSAEYDPMIAKLVAWGSDRGEARRRAIAALKETFVLGIITNVGFLKRICESEWFATADFHTRSLDELGAEGALRRPQGLVDEVLAAAVYSFARGSALRGAKGPETVEAEGDPYSPFDLLGDWRSLPAEGEGR